MRREQIQNINIISADSTYNNEGAVPGGGVDLVRGHHLGHARERHELVQLPLVLLRGDLANGRQKAGGVDEAADPRHLRNLAGVVRPLLQLEEAVGKVLDPRAEGLHAGPGLLGPRRGHPVHVEGGHQGLHGLAHRELAREAELQLLDGAPDLVPSSSDSDA